MSRTFKRLAVGVATIALAVGGGSAAWAGLQDTYLTVTVSAVYGNASGSLGNARNSDDTVQYIGCGVAATPGAPSMSCYAEDANHNYGSCHSSDPALMQAAATVNGDSYLFFEWNTQTGVCTYLSVSNASYLAPKS